MSDRSRHAPYSQKGLPGEKRTIQVYGEKDDTGKWFRCWYCGQLNNIDQAVLLSGGSGVSGSHPITNLSLLLHMNGSNGSTTFTDSSPESVHTVTANGDAQISTAQYKFGSSSGLFDGTGDYLTIPDNADFNLSGGYWTADFWLRGGWSGSGTNETIYFQRTDANNYFNLYVLKESVGYGIGLSIYASGSEVVSITTNPGVMLAGTWTHVEVSEYLNNYRIYIDGCQRAMTNDDSRPANYTGTVHIGASNATGSPLLYLNGYLDEFAIWKTTRHLDSVFDVLEAAYNPSGFVSGNYSSDVSAGCSFCGSTNYR